MDFGNIVSFILGLAGGFTIKIGIDAISKTVRNTSIQIGNSAGRDITAGDSTGRDKTQ